MHWTRPSTVVPGAEVSLDLAQFSTLARLFRPKVIVDFTRGHYQVKTARTKEEVLEALSLRHEIFHGEFMGGEAGAGIDIDRYDAFSDHLCIIDLRLSKIVGTYRLLSSEFTNSFYSESEFQLAQFLSIPGRKLELGRACVHKDYRSGLVISLLWRGIGNYMQQSGARYLFGCASVKTLNVAEILGVHRSLVENEVASDQYAVRPHGEYKIHAYEVQFRRHTLKTSADSPELKELPPLFSAYLRAGAKVYGYPALDSAFECADFFTVLDVEALPENYRQRFLKPSKGA